MSKDVIPKSFATNAYDLLTDIRTLIVEEPKRYNQSSWLKQHVTGPGAPACGTIGCVAGWIKQLTEPDRKEHAQAVAERVLNDKRLNLYMLFRGGAIEDLASSSTPTVGTNAYAALGDRHIRNFQQQNKKALRSIPVTTHASRMAMKKDTMSCFDKSTTPPKSIAKDNLTLSSGQQKVLEGLRRFPDQIMYKNEIDVAPASVRRTVAELRRKGFKIDAVGRGAYALRS